MENKILELENEIQELKARVRLLENKLFDENIQYSSSRSKEGLLKEAPGIIRNIKSTSDSFREKTAKTNLKEKNSSRARISEDKLAGTWFNRLGILAIMLAVGFFLKWSFDNRLIGELGRIVIGITIGIGFLGAGEIFQRRKYGIYGQGFTGGGIAILYFSIFSAFEFYNLISQPLAFTLMVLITLTASLLAVRYDSLAVGILGIVGGFATPFLLSNGNSNIIILFTYVAILDAGVLFVAFYKKWPVFNYLTFIFTYLTFAVGYSFDYHKNIEIIPLSFLTLFFIAYLAISLARNVRLREKANWADIALILTNAAVYFALSQDILEKVIRDYIGYWAVFLGVVYLIIGNFVYKHNSKDRTLGYAFLGIATGFITLAIPLQLDLFWISIAWSIEAILVIIISFRLKEFKARISGLLILGLAIIHLVNEPFRITGKEMFIFLNNTALSYIALIFATGVILIVFSRQALDFKDKIIYFGLQILTNLIVILFLTLEIDAYFDYRRLISVVPPNNFTTGYYKTYTAFQNAKDVALSITWGIHAGVLILLGFWRRLKGLRWFGLGFLVIVILKIFLYDLSSLSTPYRILSFVILGVILLGISWLYQRYKHLIIGEEPDDSSISQ